jgi:hypothetical protein
MVCRKRPCGLVKMGGDGVHQLRKVGNPDDPAVTDEHIQVGRHRHGVGQVVAFLYPGNAVCIAPRTVPDVPLVKRDIDRVGNALGVPDAFDRPLANPDGSLSLVRLEHVHVVVGVAGVQMDAVEVHHGGEALQDDLVPLVPPVLAAAHQGNARVHPLHDHAERPRLLDVVHGLKGSDLPAPVHLVSQPPVVDPIRLGVPVFSAQVGPMRIPRAIRVLDPGLRLVHRPRPHVHADVGLGAERAAVLDELIRAKPI